MTPGWQTTEFWLTLVKPAVAIALATGLIAPADAGTVNGELVNAVTAICALVASAWAITTYIRGRVALKQSQNAGITAPF